MVTETKKWIVIIGCGVLAAILIVVGLKLLFLKGSLSGTELFLFGCISIGASLLMFISNNPKLRTGGIILLAISIYLFARASGVFQQPWLIRILGATLLFGAGIAGYTALQYTKLKDGEIPAKSITSKES